MVRSGIFLGLLLGFLSWFAQGQEPITAITHVNVIDVIHGTAKPDLTVVIRGNRIVDIGAASAVRPPATAQVVDARGKFLIPGLWDMHVHLGNATESVLPLLVYYGITGVRDMGSPSFETLRRWNTEALSGKRVGPRIVAPGPILGMAPPYFWTWQVHGPEEARKAVDYLAGIGADFIKVTQSFDRETYFAVADEASRVGLPLAGHLPVNDDGNGFKVSGVEASNAGQKCFEHLHGIPLPFQPPEPQLIPTLLRNGTWVDPTLTPNWTAVHMDELIAAKDDPRLKHVVPSLRQGQWDPVVGQKRNPAFAQQMLKWRMDQVRMLYQNGIPLLAGTDLGSPYVYPGEVVKEMELFVEAGLSPLDALRTATINPARYLDRDKVLGSVEYGKYADLVVLNANPLDDIHNVEKVYAVVLNGRYLTRDHLEKMLPTFQ
jgi:Amidohydrolase family